MGALLECQCRRRPRPGGWRERRRRHRCDCTDNSEPLRHPGAQSGPAARGCGSVWLWGGAAGRFCWLYCRLRGACWLAGARGGHSKQTRSKQRSSGANGREPHSCYRRRAVPQGPNPNSTLPLGTCLAALPWPTTTTHVQLRPRVRLSSLRHPAPQLLRRTIVQGWLQVMNCTGCPHRAACHRGWH